MTNSAFRSLQEQTQLLNQAQVKYDMTHRRWRDMHERESAGKAVGPADIIERLKSENDGMVLRRNKVLFEVGEQQKKLKDLERVLSTERYTEDHVVAIENELRDVRREIDLLKVTKENIFQKTDDQLRVFRNQATAVENRRKAIVAEVTTLRISQDVTSTD